MLSLEELSDIEIIEIKNMSHYSLARSTGLRVWGFSLEVERQKT